MSDVLVCDECGSEDVEQRFHGRVVANLNVVPPQMIAQAVVWEDRYFCPRCDAWITTSYKDPDWKD